MIQWVFVFAAINGALAVALGAFGAHGLKGKISTELLAAYQTSSHYHLFHTIALLCLGSIMLRMAQDLAVLPLSIRVTAYCWMVGIILFCGSLYGLALGGPKWLGPITPIGGSLFIIGWLSLAVALFYYFSPSAS